jgi:hypothetical protein
MAITGTGGARQRAEAATGSHLRRFATLMGSRNAARAQTRRADHRDSAWRVAKPPEAAHHAEGVPAARRA